MKQPAKPASKELVPVVEQLDLLPDFIVADEGKVLGMEGITAADMAIPRLKVIQGISPELEQFSFLKPGDLFHSALEIVVPQPVLITPIVIKKSVILWRPRKMGGGILARALDDGTWQPSNKKFTIQLDKGQGGGITEWDTKGSVQESGLLEWGSSNPADENSQPAATLMYNLLCAFPNSRFTPAVLSFQRASLNVAKKLNMKLANQNRPIFQCVVRLRTFLDKTPEGDFYNTITELAGLLGTNRPWEEGKEPYVLGNKEFYLNCKSLYETVKETGLEIRDEESLQGEAQASATDSNNGSPDY